MMGVEMRDKRKPTRTGGLTWIEADDYCVLAISNRRLVRWQDVAGGLRGFLDLETGERFAIPIVKLDRHQIGPA